MSSAFEELFGVADALRGIPLAGRTDTWILADLAAAHGIPRDAPALARFPEIYYGHLARELGRPSPPDKRHGVMPGVRELLDALATRDDVYLALLTGNYETSARMKLELFDLWRYFACGAFGDAAPDRNGLLPRATARVVECGGPRVDLARVIVVGDTPLDVACAKASGARSIAVATGMHSSEELWASGADVVFEDLRNTQAVLEAISGSAYAQSASARQPLPEL
jgi:phosphoglycolate phosphatase